ncbi:MAG: sigma-54-dependent Fis family transcriptional regulator [Nitrospirae bacterium]|nr:sigma-54-dependent Fis family transcriptional regulator [Nitrospirota bacterium]NTW66982.1 sigma-54-dependent Fis family transcriptional regulator [Nitrospirota bacterium]
MKKPSILLIDDDPSLRRVIEYSLVESGYSVLPAASGEEGLALFQKGPCDAVITDITMPGMSGLDVLAKVRQADLNVPVIIITAYGTIESAVSAMKQGAFDYITKPFNRDELRITLERALKMRRLEKENVRLRAEVIDRYRFDAIVGNSEKLREVIALAGRVAPSDATVLVTGESGTGKELLARGIHYSSGRSEGPFVAVNCAAIPENLIESELFGHVKGAFTGAVRDREGKFELADGGTIFLDEIGDLRVDLQAKILRTLQERTVDRVGGVKQIDVDVRVIAATNKDLEREVREGNFREDLYYRLSVVTLQMPPLRDRKDDIPVLAEHFLRKFSPGPVVRLAPDALAILSAYGWPGNVRELENVMERASILKRGDTITREDLPEKLSRKAGGASEVLLNLPEDGLSLEELEKDLIIKALEKHKGNQTRAAEYLRITRPTLIYRMEKYGLK